MKMRKFMVAALATAMTVGSVMTASAAWVQEGATWKYQNDNGTYQAGNWFQDGGRWYHFDNAGNMQKGWFQDTDGKWYFLDYSGSMVTGLIKVDDNVYFMDEHGALFMGDKNISGTNYTFGLYGTTNGKPAVASDRVYGGNGNQSIGTNSGSSSSSNGGNGGGGNQVTEEVKDAVKEVEDAKEDIKAVAPTTVEDVTVTIVSGNSETAKVAVDVKTKGDLDLTKPEQKAEVEAAVVETINSVLPTVKDGSDVIVHIDGITLPKNNISVDELEGRVDELVARYVSATNYEAAKKADITVTVDNVKVTYTISLSK